MSNARRGHLIIATCEFPPFPGGIGTYAGEIARSVADAGNRVQVICPHYEHARDCVIPGVERYPLLRHHGIPPRSIMPLLNLLRHAPAEAYILGADIRTILLLYLLKPFHRRRYRAMVHGSEASKFRPGSFLFGLVRRAYLGADLVAYNSIATQRIFNDQIGVPSREVISYLGVDKDWFEPVDGSFENPDIAAIAPDMPVFCSVGRLEPRKGQLETVRAIALARDEFGMADAVYVIAGRAEDSAYEASIIAEAHALNVRTILTGRLATDDIKRLYRRASAHLLFARPLPGKVEGFGLVLLEAAAQLCPSIASETGGIPEVLGETGEFVPADNICALAAKIAAAVDAPDWREQKGKAARERAFSFSWHSCAQKTFPELV